MSVTEHFSYSPYALPYLGAALVMIVLAVSVLVRERGSAVGRAYALYAIGPIAWMGGTSSSFAISDPALFLRLNSVSIALITLSVPALYQFVILTGERPPRARRKAWLVWALAVLFVVLLFQPGVLVDGVYQYGWGMACRPTPWMLFLIGYMTSLVVLCMRHLWRGWRNGAAAPVYRRRNRLLFVGMCVSLLAFVDVLPSYGLPMPPVGGIFSVIFFAVVSYVAWRYRLTEITPEVAAAQVLATMSEALLVVDADEVVRLANPAAQRLFGDDDLAGRPLARILGDRELVADVRRCLGGEKHRTAQLEYGSGAQRRVLWLSVAPLRRGRSTAHICVFNDITALQQAESERERLSRSLETTLNELAAANRRIQRKHRRDPLTGLYNRRHLEEALDQMWRGARRQREPLAVLIVDLDHFRAVNGTYGRMRGDELLRKLAAVLQEAAHYPGTLTARLGSDEFAIVLPGTDAAGAVAVAERVQRLTALCLAPEDGNDTLSVCIGIATAMPSADDAGTPQTLLHAADAALLHAKQHGKDRICVASAAGTVT